MLKKIICMLFLITTSTAALAVQCPTAEDWVSSDPVTGYDGQAYRVWTVSDARKAEGWQADVALPADIDMTTISKGKVVVKIDDNRADTLDAPSCYIQWGWFSKHHLITFIDRVVNLKTLQNFNNSSPGHHDCSGNNCSWEWDNTAECPGIKDFNVLQNKVTLKADKITEGWQLESEVTLSTLMNSLSATTNIVDITENEFIPHCALTLSNGDVITTKNTKKLVSFHNLNLRYYGLKDWGVRRCIHYPSPSPIQWNACQWSWADDTNNLTTKFQGIGPH